MRRGLLVAILVVGLQGATVLGQTQTFQGGLIDGFALPADIASPSPQLVSSYHALAGSSFQDFDLIPNVNGGSIDRPIPHTFTGLPSSIIAATLELRVRGGNADVSTDGIILSFVDAATPDYLDDMVYARTFGRFDSSTNLFASDPGLLTSGTWSSGHDVTFTLDLANLTTADGGTLNLLPDLNANGFLDVLVGDETGVDYMLLSVTVREPATLSLDIKPGSCRNPLNRKSRGKLPTAILGTADFDVSSIDLASAELSRADGLGGSVGPLVGKSNIKDVGTPFDGELCGCAEERGDGIDDLSMKFSVAELVETLELGELEIGESVELVVSGNLVDGTAFEARDCVWLKK